MVTLANKARGLIEDTRMKTTQMRPIQAPGTPTGFGDVMRTTSEMPATPRIDEIAGDMMQSDSPLMRQAATRGFQAANRRGLLNSSIAVGEAQRSQLDAVLPMASAQADINDRNVGRQFEAGQRDADRAFQERQAELDRANQMTLAEFDADTREKLTNIEIAARERLANLDIKAADRRSAEGMISNLLSLEQNTIANIMANKDLSASERRSQIQAAEQRLATQMDMVNDLFEVDITQFDRPELGIGGFATDLVNRVADMTR